MSCYKLWVCDVCGDNAECEPGELCEVCSEGTIQVVEVVPVKQRQSDLERWDAVVADAIEAELRRWFPRLDPDPVYLRTAAEYAARRARRDLEVVEGRMWEIREAADA